MERRTRVIVVALITIAVALLLLFLADRVSFFTGKAIADVGPNTEFVECLNDKGFVLLGYNGNVFVDAQFKMLGDSGKSINYIDCSISMRECVGSVVYPSWKTKSGIVVGGLSPGTLSALSGCKL